MTQVSKRYLPPWIMDKIIRVFLDSFLKIKDDKTAESFFEEFLTPTEKVMLMKRITCLYLLYKKVNIREAANILKLSTATVAEYSILMQKNKIIPKIFEKILKEENFNRLIDKLIHEYLHPPGRVGTSWQSVGLEKIAYEQRKTSPL